MDLPLVITYSVEVYFTKWKYPQHYSAVFSGFCCNRNQSTSAARYIKLRDHAHITSSHILYSPQSGSHTIIKKSKSNFGLLHATEPWNEKFEKMGKFFQI